MCDAFSRLGPRCKSEMRRVTGAGPNSAFSRFLELYLTNVPRALAAVAAWNEKSPSDRMTATLAELAVQGMHRGDGTAPLLLAIAKMQGVNDAGAMGRIADGKPTAKAAAAKAAALASKAGRAAGKGKAAGSKSSAAQRRPGPKGSAADSGGAAAASGAATLGSRAAKRPRAEAAVLPEPVATSLSKPLLTGDRNALGETVCHRCKSNLDEGDILLCDGCELEFHRKCLRVPLASVPACDWLCDVCLAAAVFEGGAVATLFKGTDDSDSCKSAGDAGRSAAVRAGVGASGVAVVAEALATSEPATRAGSQSVRSDGHSSRSGAAELQGSLLRGTVLARLLRDAARGAVPRPDLRAPLL